MSSTLFWAGEAFAPKLVVKDARGNDVNIQTFLQEHFLNMFDEIMKATGDLEAVLGYEVRPRPSSFGAVVMLFAVDHERTT